MSDLSNALKHKYSVTPGGPFVPGVTTILNIIDKPALKWSASEIAALAVLNNTRRKKKIVEEHRAWLLKGRPNEKKATLARMGSDDEVFVHWARGEFDRQWRAKAATGTRIHDVAERWTRGESVEVTKEDAGYVDALEAFHTTYKPRFALVECVVLNKALGYGGRFDAIAELDGPDASGAFNIDYKTGGEYEDSVAMQHIGYMACELPIYDEKGALISFAELPPLDGARTVYLKADGTFKVSDPFAKIPMAVAWNGFEACLNLYKATESIKQLLEESADE